MPCDLLHCAGGYECSRFELRTDSLDLDETLSHILRLPLAHFADWCGVDLCGEPGAQLDRVAVAHVDPAKVEMAQELARRYPADPRADRGVHEVVRTGESQLWPDIPDALKDPGGAWYSD